MYGCDPCIVRVWYAVVYRSVPVLPGYQSFKSIYSGGTTRVYMKPCKGVFGRAYKALRLRGRFPPPATLARPQRRIEQNAIERTERLSMVLDANWRVANWRVANWRVANWRIAKGRVGNAKSSMVHENNPDAEFMWTK